MPEDLSVAMGAESVTNAEGQQPEVTPDDGDDIVSAYDLLNERNKQSGEDEGDAGPGSKKSSGKKAAVPDTKKEPPQKEPEPQKQRVPSQSEIDAAFGRRLAREQRKWADEHQESIDFSESMRKLYGNKTLAEILTEAKASRAEALSMSPEALDMIVPSTPARSRAPQEEGQQQTPVSASGGQDNRSLARRIIEESTAVQARYPGFDPREFIKNPDAVAKLRQGYSLMDAFVITNLDQISASQKEAGGKEALESVRQRNARVPEPSRGSGGAVGKIDPKDLSDDDILFLRERARKGDKISF